MFLQLTVSTSKLELEDLTPESGHSNVEKMKSSNVFSFMAIWVDQRLFSLPSFQGNVLTCRDPCRSAEHVDSKNTQKNDRKMRKLLKLILKIPNLFAKRLQAYNTSYKITVSPKITK